MNQEQSHVRSKMKKWRKWLMWSSAVFLLIVLLLIGGTYLYIKSISLDDIQARHTAGVESGATDTKPKQPAKVPAIIKNSLEKASDLVGKPVDGQDALDVAAILLKAGLSLKEINYLQGKATYDLTIEQKQKIRDLLLSKLNDEEIAALRSITTKYGKGLLILDPDFPIEGVGENYSPKYYEALKKYEEVKKKKAETAATSTPVSAADSAKPAASTKKPTTNPMPSPAPVLTDKQSDSKEAIDAKYTAQLNSLRANCKARSDSLISDITAELEANPDGGLAAIQQKFLNRLMDMEEECDNEFASILSAAKTDYGKAGLSEASMPNWQTQYDQAKADARTAGLTAISSHLKKS